MAEARRSFGAGEGATRSSQAAHPPPPRPRFPHLIFSDGSTPPLPIATTTPLTAVRVGPGVAGEHGARPAGQPSQLVLFGQRSSPQCVPTAPVPAAPVQRADVDVFPFLVPRDLVSLIAELEARTDLARELLCTPQTLNSPQTLISRSTLLSPESGRNGARH
jgi:hypothetical protein